MLLPLWQGAEDQDGPGSACRRGQPVQGLPQRQENVGFAAVVARGGGPKCPGMHLPQRSASPWTSTTAGKCGFRCRCGKGRRTKMAREVPVAGASRFRDFRNGRKMWDLLPLWQEAEDRSAPGCTSRRGRPVPGLPQRQENADSAAVVARGGGPRWPGKCLSQGPAGSGTSATAGKCGICCRCGKRRRTGGPQGAGNRSGRKGRKSGAIWNDGTSSVIPPEGPPTAASPRPSTRRQGPSGYSS